MLGYYLNTGAWYLAIGFTAAIIYYYILRQKSVGNFWGALIVGVLGAFIGALIDFLFSDLIYFLANINDSINLFPPIFTSIFVLWIFSNISRGQ